MTGTKRLSTPVPWNQAGGRGDSSVRVTTSRTPRDPKAKFWSLRKRCCDFYLYNEWLVSGEARL